MLTVLRRGAVTLLKVLRMALTALVIGCLGGLLGAAFHISVDKVTLLRQNYPYILFALPAVGCAITFAYHKTGMQGIGTDRILESIHDGKSLKKRLIPLIFGSTVLTHLAGGSAGREGAALQLGGTLGYHTGKLFRMDENDEKLCVSAGMAAVFSALFGTPLGAAFFSLEVTSIGMWYTAGLIPCLTAAFSAQAIASLLGTPPTRFVIDVMPSFTIPDVLRLALLAALCAYVSILLCEGLHSAEKHLPRLIKNPYLLSAVGGAALIALTYLCGSTDYNGGGMDVIARAIGGSARPEAFILKLLFTVITISCGFKGGEVVPSFFIGACFGCVVGPLLGLPAGFSAAVGMICVFCGAVNCPIASVLLACEIFGTGLPFFAIACAIAFTLSGRYSLYSAQHEMFSRINAHTLE